VSIPFSGPITPQARHDLRALYQRQSRLNQALLVLGSVWALTVACFPTKVAALIFRLPPFRQEPLPLAMRLLFLAVAAVLVLAPFGRARWWYRWWWPRVQPSAAEALSGRVSERGVRWGPGGETISWQQFTAAKISADAVLLYQTRAYALPFHRTMFQDPKDWDALIRLVEKSLVPFQRFA
jgi:hypothetical protein